MINTKLYDSKVLVIILLTLLPSLRSCECQNGTIDDNSATSQQNLIDQSSLLGPQLQHKKFKDFFTTQEIQELDLEVDTPIILEQDEQENIYQISVLRQKGHTCGYHAIRNWACLIAFLENASGKFKEYYSLMLNEKSYEQFQQSTSLNEQMSAERTFTILNKIKNKEIVGIPQESEKHIDKFTLIDFFPLGVDQSKKELFEKRVKEIITNIESLGKDKIDTLARDICIIYEQEVGKGTFNALRELYNLATGLLSKDNLAHGFKVVVGTGVFHAICVIMHKAKDNIEFLLADSLNSNFKYAYQGNYWKAVKFVKSIITKQEYFKELLVRYIYSMLLFSNQQDADNMANLGYSMIHFDNYNLKECALYQNIYKTHFIDLLNKYQHKFSEQDYEAYLNYFSKKELKIEDL